jgi:hypothetical protein
MKALFSILLLGHTALAAAFPEELGPRKWDRACLDWPVQVQPEYAALPPNPSTRTEKVNGFFRVYSQMHIQPSLSDGVAKLFDRVDTAMGRVAEYSDWVLPGINDKPGGGRYFVSVDSLEWQARGRNLFIISGPYSFGVLGFRRSGFSSLWYRNDGIQKNDCPALRSERKTLHTYRMTPHPDLLKMLIAQVWVLQTPKRVELRLRVAAQPSQLVFELLPEALVRHELEARGQRIFDNFVQKIRL